MIRYVSGIFVIWAYPSLVNSIRRISQINEESLFPIRKGLFSLAHRRFFITFALSTNYLSHYCRK